MKRHLTAKISPALMQFETKTSKRYSVKYLKIQNRLPLSNYTKIHIKYQYKWESDKEIQHLTSYEQHVARDIFKKLNEHQSQEMNT